MCLYAEASFSCITKLGVAFRLVNREVQSPHPILHKWGTKLVSCKYFRFMLSSPKVLWAASWQLLCWTFSVVYICEILNHSIFGGLFAVPKWRAWKFLIFVASNGIYASQENVFKFDLLLLYHSWEMSNFWEFFALLGDLTLLSPTGNREIYHVISELLTPPSLPPPLMYHTR